MVAFTISDGKKHAPRGDTQAEYFRQRARAVHETDHKGLAIEFCVPCLTLLRNIDEAERLVEAREVAAAITEAAAEREMKRLGYL